MVAYGLEAAASVSVDLGKLHLQRFAEHIAEGVLRGGQQFAFFLGAGCSISSGVLPASTLCLQWIRELKRQEDKIKPAQLRSFSDLEFAEWYRNCDSNFDEKRAGEFYSSVMRRRFPNAALRRMETQRFVMRADPGVGYQLLAALMLNSKAGPYTNVVLTTNFDDLVYDSLNLFYHTRPLIIAHNDIARRAIPPINRPLVLKLHGDALLEPLNTPEETEKLAADVAYSMSAVLRGRGVVFMGYSGGDRSIMSVLAELSSESLSNGVYWVNKNLPTNPALTAWLIERAAVWVDHTDFDTTMMALSHSFGLSEPSGLRFKRLLEDAEDARGIVERKLKRQRARANSTKYLDALKVELRTPPKKTSEEIYSLIRNSVDEHPTDAHIRGYYAHHLSINGKYEEAYKVYIQALDIDPDNVQNLCHLASIVVDHKWDSEEFQSRLDRAERLLRRACNSDPKNPRALGSLASFLWTRRSDRDSADAFFQKALQEDPNNTETMASYANFIWRAYNLTDEAIEYYNAAIKRNPDNMRIQANFSQLLFIKDDDGRACRYAKNALKKASSKIIRLEAAFYLYVFDRRGGREKYISTLKALIDAGIRSPGWDLEPSVLHAKKSGKDTLLIEALGNVISKGTLAERLLEFADWKSA